MEEICLRASGVTVQRHGPAHSSPPPHSVQRKHGSVQLPIAHLKISQCLHTALTSSLPKAKDWPSNNQRGLISPKSINSLRLNRGNRSFRPIIPSRRCGNSNWRHPASFAQTLTGLPADARTSRDLLPTQSSSGISFSFSFFLNIFLLISEREREIETSMRENH
uniref:Uncharacterized protein n=1 Tax=Myotis myotis TaxID=51298 RepID=A0A7J7WW17_MYOMY|nr:hypothetical protein mMyoMyo1_011988 [Myotis myotis]